MTCPTCGQRKARRACPALGRQICAICCGTKRLVEIQCPDTCSYLHTARHHPPAVVLKQRERDFEALGPTMRGLTEPQQQLGILLLGAIGSEGAAQTLDRIVDADVVAAAAALAGTYETASRGVIYEHRATSAPAQRLAASMRELLERIAADAGAARQVERDAAVALRALERGIPPARAALGGPAAPERTFLELVARLLGPRPPDEIGPAERDRGGPLIVPG